MASQQFSPYEMELFRTDSYYVLLNSVSSLWCNRKTGAIEVKPGWELANAGDPECVGVFYGVVGRLEVGSVARLLLIKSTACVGRLPLIGTVHKVCAVAVLNIQGTADVCAELGLRPCKKHGRCGAGTGLTSQISNLAPLTSHKDGGGGGQLAKTWGSIKSATSSIKNTTQQAAALATSQVKGSSNGGGGATAAKNSTAERHERRILDEVQRMFADTDSFYFSVVGGAGGQPGDLTNSMQRQGGRGEGGEPSPPPTWHTVDDRFFWNKHMLRDIIQLNNPLADYWILPIIQGFVQIETCQLEVGFDPYHISMYAPKYETLTISLVSRRSRHRAGTRYKRRGLDEAGRCANYVETEQLVWFGHHSTAFTQVRGSVPVYWSQPGYKYRPPPRIDKGEAETRLAFAKHFEDETACYGPVCIVNLVEQAGKERVIWDAYTQHVLHLNSPQLLYATFDFHEYCRGMHFENVSVLVAELSQVLHDFGFCWLDRQGIICRQTGVFRTNCIDCLDRTNVVQTALAKAMLQMQLTKLGLVPPEGSLPAPLRRAFQLLWANNGDIISKQYAGTNALKGDYTRTGERKLSGMMKDGMNSANRYWRVHLRDDYRQAAISLMLNSCPVADAGLLNSVTADAADLLRETCASGQRQLLLHPSSDHLSSELRLAYGLFTATRYYLSRFKDVYRQATIDIMQGGGVSEELASLSLDDRQRQEQEEDSVATAEHVKLLIEDCKRMLISDSAMVLGAWGLIDADPQTGDPSETDMDTILILTRDSYYVADYDEDIDQITKYYKVMLTDVESVELGPMHIAISQSLSISIFNKARGKSSDVHCLRINYTVDGDSGYYHTFRSTNLRFFNNVAVVIHNDDEMIESLRAICETLEVGLQIAGMGDVVPVAASRERLERRVSKQRCDVTNAAITRNVSETQLHSLKNVGSKALSNVTQQFNKLNKLGHSFNTRRRHSKTSVETSLKPSGGVDIQQQQQLPIETAMIASEWQEHEQDGLVLGEEAGSGTGAVHRKSTEYFTPGAGIIMSSTDIGQSLPQNHHIRQLQDNITHESLERVIDAGSRKYPLLHANTEANIDVSKLPAVTSSGGHPPPPTTPEIVITRQQSATQHSQQFGRTRQFSHSSGEVDDETKQSTGAHHKDGGAGSGLAKHSTSEKDLVLAISTSQSETAIKSMMRSSVLSSPSAVLSSPFSKIARGVQTLGANLDPRKLKGGGGGGGGSSSGGVGTAVTSSDARAAEVERLQQMWKNAKCKTRLIAV